MPNSEKFLAKRGCMKKPYEAHEIAYQKMKKEGIRSWDERYRSNSHGRRRQIDIDTKRFLVDVLAQPWTQKGGKAIELGCGTAPILKWVCKKGFSGLGVDVSKTAITMAREQSNGLNIRFRQGDICKLNVNKAGKFDLVADGHCLHCITVPEDRKTFLKNAFGLLKRGGLFIVMTMCAPVDRKIFSNTCEGQKLIDHTIYAPYEKAREYEGFRTIGGCDYVPTRYIAHWRNILSEIRKAGFQIKLFRCNYPAGQDPTGSLAVGALA